jgi:hypothetical protein
MALLDCLRGYAGRLDAAPRSSDCRSRSICFCKFAGNSRSSFKDARSRSPISLTIAQLWQTSMSTTFGIAGSPMNPEGRWFRIKMNGGPSPLAIVRERLLLKQCSSQAGPKTFGYPRHAPFLTAGDGPAQASDRRRFSFRVF